MSDFSRFRPSLNGFNRSDVTEYIEAASLAHQKELRKLTDENERLRTENASLSAQLRAAQAALSEACLQMDALRREAEERVQAEAEQAACAAQDKPEEEPLSDGPEQECAVQEDEPADLTDMELEAYRRAEAMERNAIHRAERLTSRMSVLCENARSRYLESSGELAALSEDIKSAISRLEETLADVQVIFDDTESAFDELELPDAE